MQQILRAAAQPQHNPALVAVCKALQAADAHIVWEAHLQAPEVPSDEELRAQERERRLAWQAGRFAQLKEMLR
jgi:hypothetical protein